MSDTSPQAEALLQRARELLEPEPAQLAAVRGALARKLEAGAAPSCGELEVLGGPGLAPRGLWTLGGKLGLAAGLTVLAGAGVLVLRAAPDAAVRSAAAPPSAAHAPGPDTAAQAPAVMEPAATSAAQDTAAASPAAIAVRPPRTRSSARPAATAAPELSRNAPHPRDTLARAVSARGARRAPAVQPTRGTEPTLESADPSAAASPAATPYLAANSSSDQNIAATDRPAALPPLRQTAMPVAEGERVAPEQPRSAARAADEARVSGVRDRPSVEQQHPSGARVPEHDRLAREVAMLDGARAAQERGDNLRALQILDAYGREFPAGALKEEHLALRAQALCALGRIDEGRRVVQRLAARAPESPHLKRSQATCRIAE